MGPTVSDREINAAIYGALINGRKSTGFRGEISPLFLWSYGPLLITGFWGPLCMEIRDQAALPNSFLEQECIQYPREV